jgi:hypothetical protein
MEPIKLTETTRELQENPVTASRMGVTPKINKFPFHSIGWLPNLNCISSWQGKVLRGGPVIGGKSTFCDGWLRWVRYQDEQTRQGNSKEKVRDCDTVA